MQLKIENLKTHDCNNCARKNCKGDFIVKGDRKSPRSVTFIPCKGVTKPEGTFPLIELAIFHPQGIIDTFKSLKGNLKVRLNITSYLQ